MVYRGCYLPHILPDIRYIVNEINPYNRILHSGQIADASRLATSLGRICPTESNGTARFDDGELGFVGAFLTQILIGIPDVLPPFTGEEIEIQLILRFRVEVGPRRADITAHGGTVRSYQDTVALI